MAKGGTSSNRLRVQHEKLLDLFFEYDRLLGQANIENQRLREAARGVVRAARTSGSVPTELRVALAEAAGMTRADAAGIHSPLRRVA